MDQQLRTLVACSEDSGSFLRIQNLMPPSGLLRYLRVHGTHTYTQLHMYTHKIKYIKIILKSRRMMIMCVCEHV